MNNDNGTTVENFRRTKFSIGSRVCLGSFATRNPDARQASMIVDICGGNFPRVVKVDPSLEGLHYWDVNELVLASSVPANQKTA